MRDDGHDKREMSLPPGPHHPNDARDLEPLGSSALQGRGMVYVAVENFTTDLKRSVVRSSFLLLLLLLFFFFFYRPLPFTLFLRESIFIACLSTARASASEYRGFFYILLSYISMDFTAVMRTRSFTRSGVSGLLRVLIAWRDCKIIVEKCGSFLRLAVDYYPYWIWLL
jgi:hypothetical protein